MKQRISDDMLMAFVDGELDGAAAEDLRRAISIDPVLADRAAKFRMTCEAVRDAYAEVRMQPAPEAMIAAVVGHRSSSVVQLSRRRAIQAALPIAASIALLFGVAGYWYGQQGPSGSDPLGSNAVAEALGATTSGEHRIIELGDGNADFTTLATYRVEGGLCRTFEVSGAQLQNVLRGVGCNRGADWTVELTVAQAGGGGAYAPASDAATGSIDAFLDALEAQPIEAEGNSSGQ